MKTITKRKKKLKRTGVVSQIGFQKALSDAFSEELVVMKAARVTSPLSFRRCSPESKDSSAPIFLDPNNDFLANSVGATDISFDGQC
jgi:hypothetical protein